MSRSSTRIAWFVAILAAIAACRDRTPADVEMEIRSIGVDHQSGSPVIVLQNKEGSVALPIWIGLAEAQAIALEMEGISPSRPMTHDLVKSILDEAGVALERVSIVDLRDSTYFALLHLEANGKSLKIDSRPSDAIALAVRFHKPIFVAAELLEGETGVDLRSVEGAGGRREGIGTSRGVTVQTLSPQLAEYFGIERRSGVLISAVDLAVPGLRRGDVVLAINGDVVANAADFEAALASLEDEPAILTVVRGRDQLTVALPAAVAQR